MPPRAVKKQLQRANDTIEPFAQETQKTTDEARLTWEDSTMAQTSSSDKTVDVAELKIEQMLQVADIILIAQQAKRTELLAIKTGLDAAFGGDWKEFKPSKLLPKKNQTTDNQQKSAAPSLQIDEIIATQKG